MEAKGLSSTKVEVILLTVLLFVFKAVYALNWSLFNVILLPFISVKSSLPVLFSLVCAPGIVAVSMKLAIAEALSTILISI